MREHLDWNIDSSEYTSYNYEDIAEWIKQDAIDALNDLDSQWLDKNWWAVNWVDKYVWITNAVDSNVSSWNLQSDIYNILK